VASANRETGHPIPARLASPAVAAGHSPVVL